MRHDPIPTLKAELAREIARITAGTRTWDAAVMMGTHRSRVARVRSGRVEDFTVDTLIRFLARLRHRVELRVVPEPIPRK